jgi:hypothetical protein
MRYECTRGTLGEDSRSLVGKRKEYCGVKRIKYTSHRNENSIMKPPNTV